MYQGKSTFGLMVQELCAEGGYAVLLIHLQRQQCSQIYIRRLLQVQAPTVYSALAKNLASYSWMTMATRALALTQMISKTINKACFSRLHARTVTKSDCLRAFLAVVLSVASFALFRPLTPATHPQGILHPVGGRRDSFLCRVAAPIPSWFGGPSRRQSCQFHVHASQTTRICTCYLAPWLCGLKWFTSLVIYGVLAT